jgi:hypothetical protein
MMVALARIALRRVVGTARTWLPVGGWVAVALLSAIMARMRGASAGADEVMRGTFGFVGVPLVAYAMASAAVAGGGLRPAIRSMVALGAPAKIAALATTLVAMAATALVCVPLAALVCVVAHGPADAPLARDVFASAWVSALGGAAYAAYFVAGSAFAGGAARAFFLIADFFLGAGAGVSSLFTPRGHVQSLLGGPLAAELPQRASFGMLVALVAAYTLLALRLARRA